MAKDDTQMNRSLASAGKTYVVDMEIQNLRQAIYGMSGLQDRLQNSTKKTRAAIQKEFDAAYDKLTSLEAKREELLAGDKKAAQDKKDANLAASRKKAAAKAAELEDKAKAADLAKNPKLAASLRAQASTERQKAKVPKVEDTTGGSSGTPLPLSDEQIVQNEFAKAGVSADGTVQYGFPNPKGEGLSAMQAYVYVEPGKPGGAAYDGSTLRQRPEQDKAFAFGTTDEVVNKYYTQLVKQYGSKSALAQKLADAGKLSNAKNADRGRILNALNGVVATYTADNTIAIKNGEIKELPTMDEYLSGLRGKGGGMSYTRTSAEIFDETTATRVLNQVAQSLTGKNYPQEKLKEGITVLQAMQKKMPQKTTVTEDEQGRQVSTVTKTGIDPTGFLISQIAQTDAAKEKQVLDYYQVFKNSFGVR